MSYTLESDLVADAKRACEAMGVVLEVAGQRRADKAGQDRGLPDAFLHAGGRTWCLEFKKPKAKGERCGRFSLDQLVAAERRRRCGVETYAPSILEHVVALANFARCGSGVVCQDCPTVPTLT